MKTRYKIGCWLGGCVLGLSVVFGVLVFMFFHTFYPSPPRADYPPAPDLATAQRQDLDYFQNYFTLNRAYSPDALAKVKALHREALVTLKSGPFTAAAFDLTMLRMVALSDNGHSQSSRIALTRTVKRIPCRFYHFTDGYYVIRARQDCAGLLGAKLLSIDGMSVDAVADYMYRYWLGPRNHYDQFVAPFFMESPDLLQAAGLAEGADRLNLRVRMRDGSERDVTMVGNPPNAKAPYAYPVSYLSPQHIDDEGPDWAGLLPRDAALPLFLHDYYTPFQTAWWTDKQTYYVQFRSNMDEPGHPIRPFAARVEQEIIAHKPRFIVLDLRLNQGGNFATTASLMKRITTLADSIQHVYVLTGVWQFSAGNVSLALVKEHGGDKVTTVG